jgi:hypothetical protein
MSKKREFKIGDQVQVRSWKSMKKEFGLWELGIGGDCGFVGSMRPLCGRQATISSVNDNGSIKLEHWSDESGDVKWSFSADMFKHVKPSKSAPIVQAFKSELILEAFDEVFEAHVETSKLLHHLERMIKK